MKHELPKLPFALDALAPHLSKETLEFHYGKHHQAYVDKLNSLIPGTEFERASLEEIVRNAKGVIFNQAAQVWNHTFYWHSLSPKGVASHYPRWRKPSRNLSAPSTLSRRISAIRRQGCSGLAGPGSSRNRMAGSRWYRQAMRKTRSPAAIRPCSPAMYGSMPITLITAMPVQNTSRPGGRS